MKSNKTLIIAVAALVAIAIIALCALGAIFLITRGGDDQPTATVPPTVPPTVESGTDDSWERVQAAGKILMGTSADYPPYEYLTDDHKLDGFDIALMDEIGKRLGVEVEYHDIAFDGLGGALQIGQIDAAIAAISVTPDREAEFDFSNIYFVGLDGLIARNDSTVGDITSADQLAGYRLGVQRATVYEGWAQDTLVSAGIMPANNLYTYELAGDAVRDLEQNRVDLVMLDEQPAQAAVQAGGLRLVGSGLNQQRLALAVPKGATTLRTEIDRVLTDLQNEGFVTALAKQYLNLDPDNILPTPTPTPVPAATSTPVPPPTGCVDGLELVQHLSHDDQDMSNPPVMQPGEPFTKKWRVENTGTCTWNSGYRLVYAHGNDPAAQMGGQPLPVQGEVAPGQTYDLALNLVAPLRAGTYRAQWQMENGAKQAFGERLPVGIMVPSAPTATPAPTQTPVPGISFTVDRDHIKHGECVVFSWNVENVEAVYFYAEGQRWQDNGVAGVGSQTECPPVTTTYYLRVVSRDGSVDQRAITITVEGAVDAPYIKRFTVDPPDQITLGQCVRLQWNVQGQVNKITISADGRTLWDGAPVKGSTDDCPGNTGTVAYAIDASGDGGTSRGQQNMYVVDASTATPVPTSAPDLPVIYSFSVSPNQITAGDCVDINWSAGGGTSYLNLWRNSDLVADHDTDLTGHLTDCLDQDGSYTYRLEAYNDVDQQVSQQKTVNVSGAVPQNPLANTSWLATQVNGSTVLEGTSPTALFDAGSNLNGSAGCNSYSSGYAVDGSSISISPPATSSMICAGPEGIMEQEAAFLGALTSATSFSMEGSQLYLQNAGGVVEFISFER